MIYFQYVFEEFNGIYKVLWWIIEIDVFRIIWPELPEVDAAEKAIVVELSEKVDQSSHQHRQHQSDRRNLAI